MKKYTRVKILVTTLCLILFGLFMTEVQSGENAPRMTITELKKLLGNSDVIIIDVRIAKDWQTSTLKIKGAVWEDPMNFKSWADKYSKGKTLVLYCA